MGRKLAIGLVIVVVIGAGLALSGGRVQVKLGEHHAAVGKHVGHHGKRGGMEQSITVTGSGAVLVAPDTAFLSIGVETFDKEAETALDENNRRMADVLYGLKALGLTEDEIQTTTFRLSKVYLGENARKKIEPITRDGFVGYEVQNSLRVRTKNLDLVEPILGAVISWGATSLGRVSFSVEDESKFLVAAREMAIEDATEHARDLVTAAGARLGSVVSISRGRDRYSRSPAQGKRAEVLGESSPLYMTTETVGTSVSVTFRIEQ